MLWLEYLDGWLATGCHSARCRSTSEEAPHIALTRVLKHECGADGAHRTFANDKYHIGTTIRRDLKRNGKNRVQSFLATTTPTGPSCHTRSASNPALDSAASSASSGRYVSSSDHSSKYCQARSSRMPAVTI